MHKIHDISISEFDYQQLIWTVGSILVRTAIPSSNAANCQHPSMGTYSFTLMVKFKRGRALNYHHPKFSTMWHMMISYWDTVVVAVHDYRTVVHYILRSLIIVFQRSTWTFLQLNGEGLRHQERRRIKTSSRAKRKENIVVQVHRWLSIAVGFLHFWTGPLFHGILKQTEIVG